MLAKSDSLKKITVKKCYLFFKIYTNVALQSRAAQEGNNLH